MLGETKKLNGKLIPWRLVPDPAVIGGKDPICQVIQEAHNVFTTCANAKQKAFFEQKAVLDLLMRWSKYWYVDGVEHKSTNELLERMGASTDPMGIYVDALVKLYNKCHVLLRQLLEYHELLNSGRKHYMKTIHEKIMTVDMFRRAQIAMVTNRPIVMRKLQYDRKADDLLMEGVSGMMQLFVQLKKDDIKLISKIDKPMFVVWSEASKLWEKHNAAYLSTMIYDTIFRYLRDDRDKDLIKMVKGKDHSSLITHAVQYFKDVFDESFISNLDPTNECWSLAGGIVADQKTGEIRQRTKEDMFTYEIKQKLLPQSNELKRVREVFSNYCSYVDPTDKHPEEAKRRRIRDTKKEEKLLTWLAYGATPNIRMKLIFFLVGAADTGKSTLIEAVVECLGPRGSPIPAGLVVGNESSQQEDQKSHSASWLELEGIHFGHVDEVDPESYLLGTYVRKLTGKKYIKGRNVHSSVFRKFRNTTSVFVTCNDMAKMTDAARAKLAKRLLVLEFCNPLDKCDPLSDEKTDELFSEDFQSELFSLLFWEGKKLYESNLRFQVETDNKIIMKYTTDPLTAFLADHIIVDAEEKSQFVVNPEMFDVFNRYCAVKGLTEKHTLDSLNKFSTKVKESTGTENVAKRVVAYKKKGKGEKAPVMNIRWGMRWNMATINDLINVNIATCLNAKPKHLIQLIKDHSVALELAKAKDDEGIEEV